MTNIFSGSLVFFSVIFGLLPSIAKAAPQPVSINSPQGRAIYQNMMQMQANRAYFMQQQQIQSELTERGRIEKEIKAIDARLANGNLLGASEKQGLKSQRARLEKQLQATARMLKKNSQKQ